MVIPARTHQWHIDDAQYARHEARRGRRHAFETLAPERTALVIIDMVPFFCNESAYCHGIATPITELADRVRANGGTVAWVVPAVDEPSPSEIQFFGAEVAERYALSGGRGSVSERVWSMLDVGPNDVTVEKFAPSAFFPGRCDLDALLRKRSIDTVLIAGTVANVCCESSIRDASTLGYRVIAVADALAAGSDDDLNATLHTVYRSFGDVRPVSELMSLLTDQTGQRMPDTVGPAGS